jgi:hypothetical protein
MAATYIETLYVGSLIPSPASVEVTQEGVVLPVPAVGSFLLAVTSADQSAMWIAVRCADAVGVASPLARQLRLGGAEIDVTWPAEGLTLRLTAPGPPVTARYSFIGAPAP